MKHWLTGLPFRGRLRIYADYALTGYEAVVLSATDTLVRVASHNLFKGFVKELSWDKFLSEYVLALDTTPAKQTDFLLNTLRTIATRGSPDLVGLLKNHRPTVSNDPITLEELKMKKTPNPPTEAVVRLDYHKHSCVELSRTEKSVKYIPMADSGLEVFERGIDAFEEEFPTVATDYPVEKAAAVYVRFAQHLGATKAALDALGRFITISKKEYEMATAKPVTTTAAKSGVVKAGGTAKTPKAPSAPKEKRVTVASRFQDLIMEGKLTDAEIFDVVQKEFKLDDSKKGYVSWYRNYLRKHGKNPPAPKGEPLKDLKKEAKPATEKAAPVAKKTAAAKPAAAEKTSDEKPKTEKVVKRPPPPAVKKATTKQAA